MSAGLSLLHIKFLKYSNDGGKRYDGQCCDIDCNACDHYFFVCLDLTERNNKVCELGINHTGVTHDRNVISFRDFIGDTPNRIEFAFFGWPVS